jgi:hypothetical protein
MQTPLAALATFACASIAVKWIQGSYEAFFDQNSCNEAKRFICRLWDGEKYCKMLEFMCGTLGTNRFQTGIFLMTTSPGMKRNGDASSLQ